MRVAAILLGAVLLLAGVPAQGGEDTAVVVPVKVRVLKGAADVSDDDIQAEVDGMGALMQRLGTNVAFELDGKIERGVDGDLRDDAGRKKAREAAKEKVKGSTTAVVITIGPGLQAASGKAGLTLDGDPATILVDDQFAGSRNLLHELGHAVGLEHGRKDPSATQQNDPHGDPIDKVDTDGDGTVGTRADWNNLMYPHSSGKARGDEQIHLTEEQLKALDEAARKKLGGKIIKISMGPGVFGQEPGHHAAVRPDSYGEGRETEIASFRVSATGSPAELWMQWELGGLFYDPGRPMDQFLLGLMVDVDGDDQTGEDVFGHRGIDRGAVVHWQEAAPSDTPPALLILDYAADQTLEPPGSLAFARTGEPDAAPQHEIVAATLPLAPLIAAVPPAGGALHAGASPGTDLVGGLTAPAMQASTRSPMQAVVVAHNLDSGARSTLPFAFDPRATGPNVLADREGAGAEQAEQGFVSHGWPPGAEIWISYGAGGHRDHMAAAADANGTVRFTVAGALELWTVAVAGPGGLAVAMWRPAGSEEGAGGRESDGVPAVAAWLAAVAFLAGAAWRRPPPRPDVVSTPRNPLP